MKLTYFQLEAHLSKKLAPSYIVSGEELLLKQETFNLIRKAAKQAEFTERVRLTAESGFDWDQLYTHLYSTSLMGEKRLLELNFRDATPPKSAGTLLQDYAKNPSPDTLLLIEIGKIDDKIAKSPWYQALEKMGMVVTLWPITREQLPQWIMQRAAKYKISMSPDAANLLTDYVEGNLIAAAQTLEKLYLLQPKTTVDVELINSILTDESHFTVFDYIDTLLVGDKARALHILENLTLEGTEPVLILWAIARELRMLADLLQHHKQGEPLDALFQKYRVFARRQPAMRRFLMKTSVQDCLLALAKAAEIDKMIKGAAPGNVFENLQLLTLKLI